MEGQPSSSFRRKGSTTVSGSPVEASVGLKPWINGGHLVSTGNRQLDDLLGGGVGLGTVCMIESDNFSYYGETILSYGMAQSLSSGHTTVIFQAQTPPLPYNQNVGTTSSSSHNPQANGDKSCTENAGTNKDVPGSELTIAWQYRKYIKQTKANEDDITHSSKSYCCSFDLSRSLQESILMSNPPLLIPRLDEDDNDDDVAIRHSSSSSSHDPTAQLQKQLSEWHALVAALLTHHTGSSSMEQGSRDVGAPIYRMFLPQLANLAADYGTTEDAARLLVRFIVGLKQLIRDKRATVAFTLNPLTCPPLLMSRLKWASDTTLSIDSFAGRAQSVPYEFAEFCGLLTIEKVQQIGAIASFRPPWSKFGLKRDSRKLNIEPLHLPPEESRAFGTAGADPSPPNTSNNQSHHHLVVTGGGMSGSSSSHPDASTSTSSMRLQYESISEETNLLSRTSLSAQTTTGPRGGGGGGVHPAVNTPNKYQESVLHEGDTGTATTRGIFARVKATSGTSPSLLSAAQIPKPVGISIASFSRTKTPLQAPPPPPSTSTTPSGSCTQTKPAKTNSLDF